MFDEQPDGDPHSECAAEIHRLESELAEAKRLLYEASRQMPVGYQQLVNGKWEHCSVFVALGFREDLAPGFRAVYAAPVHSSPSIEREVSGEASAEGVPGAALDPESWPSAALDEARAACVTPCDGGKND